MSKSICRGEAKGLNIFSNWKGPCTRITVKTQTPFHSGSQKKLTPIYLTLRPTVSCRQKYPLEPKPRKKLNALRSFYYTVYIHRHVEMEFHVGFGGKKKLIAIEVCRSLRYLTKNTTIPVFIGHNLHHSVHKTAVLCILNKY